MSLGIGDFRQAIAAAGAEGQDQILSIKDNKISAQPMVANLKALPPGTTEATNVRQALYDSLTSLSSDASFLTTLKRMVFGENDANKLAPLKALTARQIIDHAQAISGKLSTRLDAVLRTGPFPDNVNQMLKKTVLHQSGNPIVREFLESSGSGGLYGLGRLAGLAVKAFESTVTDFAERKAIAYLSGFAGALHTKDVAVVAEENPFLEGFDKVEIADAHDIGKMKGLSELDAQKDDLPQAREGNFKEFTAVNKDAFRSYTFKQYHQNGGGKRNCLLLSVLQQTEGGFEKTTNNEAAKLRQALKDELKDLRSQGVKKFKYTDGKGDVVTLDLPEDLGNETLNKNSKKSVEFETAALLAHHYKRPIVIITTDEGSTSFARFDTDLVTRDTIKETEKGSNVMYVRYMPAKEIKDDHIDGHFEALVLTGSKDVDGAGAMKFLNENLLDKLDLDKKFGEVVRQTLLTKICDYLNGKLKGEDDDANKIVKDAKVGEVLKKLADPEDKTGFKNGVSTKMSEFLSVIETYGGLVSLDESNKITTDKEQVKMNYDDIVNAYLRELFE